MCADTLSVETQSGPEEEWQLFRTMTGQEKALIITNAHLVRIVLHSCYNLMWAESRGFSAKKKFVGM